MEAIRHVRNTSNGDARGASVPVGVREERISPERAQWYLDRMAPNQRRLKLTVVRRYAAEMTAGTWAETRDPIKLNENGELVDGQHRMHAIIRAGVTLTLLVVRIHSSAMPALDLAAGRSVRDILTVSGMARGLSGQVQAAVVLERLDFDRTAHKVQTIGKMERAQIIAATDDSLLDPLCSWGMMATRPPGGALAVALRALRMDREAAGQFFEALFSNHAFWRATHYRIMEITAAWLLGPKARARGGQFQHEAAYRTAQCWNAVVRDGQDYSKLLPYHTAGEVRVR